MKKIVFIGTNVLICLMMILIGHLWPEQIESLYSRNIYPVLTNVLVFFSRRFTVRLTEVYFFVLLFLMVAFLFLFIYHCVKKAYKKGFDYFFRILMLLTVNITLFLFLWGMNNYRLDIEELFELDQGEITQEDLEDTYLWFIEETNRIKNQLNEKDVLDLEEIMLSTDEGFNVLASEYSFISSRDARVKPLGISELFSQSGYSGIYLYVFSEPTINIMPHITSLPFVASHEMAHQQGFASEDDANFVGFLAAAHHKKFFFRYSAYLSGMTYVGNSLYRTDQEAYKKLNVLIDDGVRKDLQERSEFWNNHIQPRTEKVHNQMNDLFLKANNQPEGILNYSNVTKLLVLGYKKQLY